MGAATDWKPHLALFRRLLAGEGRARADAADGVFRLNPQIYRSPERHALEREHLFLRLPLPVAHASQLAAPGAALTVDIMGRALLLARGRDGVLRAFVNACRHRGTRLADCAEGRRVQGFTCPYHHWSYDLDGRLKHLPAPEAFPGLDPATRALAALPVAERHGLVWAGLRPDAAWDLDAFLAPISRDLDAFNIAEQQVFAVARSRKACNWKLIADAFLDSYHVVRLHQKTIGPFFADAMALSEAAGPHIRAAVARQEFSEVASLPEANWDARRHATMAYLIFPCTVLILHPDYTSILSLLPAGPEETDFVHTMLVPETPRDEKQRGHFERSFQLIEGGVFQAEDLATAERIQRSLASEGNADFVCGQYECSMRLFHGEIDRRLGAESFIP